MREHNWMLDEVVAAEQEVARWPRWMTQTGRSDVEETGNSIKDTQEPNINAHEEPTT